MKAYTVTISNSATVDEGQVYRNIVIFEENFTHATLKGQDAVDTLKAEMLKAGVPKAACHSLELDKVEFLAEVVGGIGWVAGSSMESLVEWASGVAKQTKEASD